MLICVIPLLFGFNLRYLFLLPYGINSIFFVIVGIFGIFLLGRISFILIKDERSVSQMRNHDLINSFFQKNEWWDKWIIFPLTMLMEEFIFRFYIISIFIININPTFVVVLSSLIFAIYHIHFWFRLKNLRIFLSYFILSFFLGLLNGYVFLNFGLILCFFVHYGLAFEIYHHFYVKYLKSNNKT